MPARNLTYRPAAQSTAAARPSLDGGWRVVFPPAVGTHNPRSRETTRVTPFAHLHIGSFANYSLFTIHYSLGLSVDPMSDKYPSTSPYAYCRNNPIVLVDPNGMFDTKSEARQYRREHHTGGRIRKNSQKDKFAGTFSLDNKRESISYTKPQYEESDALIIMHGLSSDGVVKSPIAHDPRTRREKFDDFETHATQTGVAICQGLATGLPISSTANDIITLTKGENMFGDKASKSDKVWATIGLATLGTGHLVKGIGKLGVPVCRKAGEIIDYIGYALDVRSGISTTRNKLKNGKKKK